MTSNQVSTSTDVKPLLIAWLTSSWAPNLNHSVRSRRISCRALSLRNAIDRKKPRQCQPAKRGKNDHSTFHGWSHMRNKALSQNPIWQIRILGLQIPNDFEVSQWPRMPRLIPLGIRLSSRIVSLKNGLYVWLVDNFLSVGYQSHGDPHTGVHSVFFSVCHSPALRKQRARTVEISLTRSWWDTLDSPGLIGISRWRASQKPRRAIKASSRSPLPHMNLSWAYTTWGPALFLYRTSQKRVR